MERIKRIICWVAGTFVTIVLFFTLLLLATSARGGELPVEGLELRGFGRCVRMNPRTVVPCAILEKKGDERALYLIIFSEDGSEIQEMVRQDYNTGKETILWRRPGRK